MNNIKTSVRRYYEKQLEDFRSCQVAQGKWRPKFPKSFMLSAILVPRAYDPSGLRQESRALGAAISGMRHRCRLRETGWAEFGYFLCYFKMVAARALDSCRRPEGS